MSVHFYLHWVISGIGQRMWAILYKNYKIINSTENLIGKSKLVQNFKEIGQEQALVETPSYWKISPECQNLLSMAITGQEKSFV